MIQAFASLFFLSYAKLCYLIWEAFQISEVRSDKSNTNARLLYIDPKILYGSAKHAVLMAFSLAVAVFIFLPPLLVLVVYPTSLYRKISHWISSKWRLRIKTYVEIFNGCFKDGTDNGSRDYRCLSGWGLLLLGVIPQLLVSIVAYITSQQTNKFMASYITVIFFIVLGFLCIWLQPYKEKHSNDLTAGLLITLSLVGTTVAGTLNFQETDMAKILMAMFLLVPHSVLWGYVVWKGIKTISSYSRCWQNTKENNERERFLYDGTYRSLVVK